MPQIEISIQENDTYGDGWQGQWVRIFDSDGTQVAAHTLEGGNSGTDVFNLDDNADYTWTFGEGSWIEESSFTMTRTDTGEVLAQANGVSLNGSFTLGSAVSDPAGGEEDNSSPSAGSAAKIRITFGGALYTTSVVMLDMSDDSFFATFGPEPLAYGDNYYIESARLGRDAGTLIHTGDGNAHNTDGNGTPKGPAVGIMTATDGGGPYDVPGYTFEYDMSFPVGEYGIQMYSGNAGVTPMTVYILDENDNVLHTVESDGSGFDLAYYSVQIGDVAPEYSFSLVPTVDSEPASDYDGDGHSPDSLGVFIQCTGGFDVYVKTEGAWDHHDSAFGTYSMLAADCGDGFLVYSTSGSQAYAWSRSSVMTDSHEDDDDLVDQFFMDAENVFDISSTEHTVSGEDSIEFPGETCQFAQVLESGRVSYDYSVTISQDSVTVSPPSGKDGQEIEIRLFF